jgi:hypothetical protein
VTKLLFAPHPTLRSNRWHHATISFKRVPTRGSNRKVRVHGLSRKHGRAVTIVRSIKRYIHIAPVQKIPQNTPCYMDVHDAVQKLKATYLSLPDWITDSIVVAQFMVQTRMCCLDSLASKEKVNCTRAKGYHGVGRLCSTDAASSLPQKGLGAVGRRDTTQCLARGMQSGWRVNQLLPFCASTEPTRHLGWHLLATKEQLVDSTGIELY